MSIFNRSKSKLNNEATAALPAPSATPAVAGPTTVHHHGPNWIGIIIGATIAGLIILSAFWFAMVYLFGQLGSRDPYRDAAGLVVYGGLAVVFLLLVSWRAGPFFDGWLGYKTEVQRELTRREEVKLLAAQTTLEPGRYNEADFQFARVVLAVMMNAYEWLEKQKRDTFPGQSRPWSMDKSKEVADKIGVPLSQDKANSISGWLFEEGIITAPERGQITPAFPTLSSVRAHLDNKYGKPIVVISPTLRNNRGFKFTG